MSENIQTGAASLWKLEDGSRVFLPSSSINIFPCSRRGQISMEGSKLNYDPEARLNTERTNRLRTAVNGFTDSFIADFKADTLVFALAGYRVEVKKFSPIDIAEALGISTGGTIYAHLSLHDGISLGVSDYHTEILYRQSAADNDAKYLDVKYSDTYFFVGISFTKEPVSDKIQVKVGNAVTEKQLVSADLALFAKNNGGNWELVQTSLLPKIKHGTAQDSIKISGDFTVEHPIAKAGGTVDTQVSFEVTKDKTRLGPVETSNLTVTGSATIGNGSVTAKNLTIDSTTGKVTTPTLDVNVITNTAEDTITINKSLTIENANEQDSPISLIVTGEATVDGSVTAKNLTINDTVGKITTPMLDVKNITNTAGTVEIVSDVVVKNKLLKIEDTASSGRSIMLEDGLVTTPAMEAIYEVSTPLLGVSTIAGINESGVYVEGMLTTDDFYAGSITTSSIKGDPGNYDKLELDGSVEVHGELSVVNNTLIIDNPGWYDTALEVHNGKTELLDLAAANTTLGSLVITGDDLVYDDLQNEDRLVVESGNINLKGNLTVGKTTGKKFIVDGADGELTAPSAALDSLTVNNKANIQNEVDDDPALTVRDGISADKVAADEIWLKTYYNQMPIGQVPALELVHLTATDTYQLRFKFGNSQVAIIEE